MATSLIIGSGPAAAGAAMALSQDSRQQITILDIGGELEADRESTRQSVASTPPASWTESALEEIRHQPVGETKGALPEKRTYGSDFPFRNVGQLDGVEAVGNANRSVVSGAYGGFSNVWGAQIMPFSPATFDRWPFSASDLLPHYQTALSEMSLTGEADDLSTLFPLLGPAQRLPRLAERTQEVLERYEMHRAKVQSLGVTVGRARLAMKSDECIRCGLCMTGCPYRLIYSASHTFDRLRAQKRVAYRSGVLAVALGELEGAPYVDVRELGSGKVQRLSADRIYVACGGIGTTRLVLGSLRHFGQPVELGESVQFVMPAISLRPTKDPRHEQDFTLNQFNVIYDASGDGFDLCQIHFYPYNPVFEAALPGVLHQAWARPMTTALLRRVSVGLGYVPSWASPKVRVTAHESRSGSLPDLVVDREGDGNWPPMLRSMARALVKIAPSLDLWPILPMTRVSPAAKSYHFGGSFPHGDERSGLGTDRLGRLANWDNIHLIDASVFPNVPATTFTLTIMANAHRIASESMRDSL